MLKVLSINLTFIQELRILLHRVSMHNWNRFWKLKFNLLEGCEAIEITWHEQYVYVYQFLSNLFIS